MGVCVKCGVEKPLELFRLRKSFVTGRHYRGKVCQKCHQEKATEWRKNNPKKVKIYARRARNKNLHVNRRNALENHFKKKFGITIEERDDLISKQGGKCAICGTDSPKGKGWCVDHCHETNKIRAILCAPCNTGIGHFGDSPKRLRAAASYLERHGK